MLDFGSNDPLDREWCRMTGEKPPIFIDFIKLVRETVKPVNHDQNLGLLAAKEFAEGKVAIPMTPAEMNVLNLALRFNRTPGPNLNPPRVVHHNPHRPLFTEGTWRI